MNRRFLTIILVLVCLSLTANKSFAWDSPPWAVISPDYIYYEYIPIGEDARFSLAAGDPDEGDSIARWEVDFDDGSTPREGNGSPPSGISHAYSSAGIYNPTLTVWDSDTPANSGSDSCEVYVVEVDRLQYNDPDTGYTDISGTLYVVVTDTVTFKAIPNPSGASWPSGKPVWGGTAGASGTGSTKAVTFNTLSSSTSDYKTVTAECGNTVTANVIVYWFQGIPAPDIIFDGRTYDEYGVEETVFLAHTTYPGGITGLPLEWKVHNGVGSVSGSTYDAEAIPGDVDLKLEITSGPNKGLYLLYGKTVVAPTNRFIRHRTETGIWHRKGQHSVVFRGESFLDPKNVSFTNIQRREGASTPAVGTGLFAPANGYVHPVGNWFTPSGPNITTGCYVADDTTGFNFGLGVCPSNVFQEQFFIAL